MNTPNDCSDETINQLFDMAENIEVRPSRIIDLRRRYALLIERDPVKGQVWIAKDLASFDPDPDSRMHIIGYGRSAQEATIELLEGIAAVAAETAND